MAIVVRFCRVMPFILEGKWFKKRCNKSNVWYAHYLYCMYYRKKNIFKLAQGEFVAPSWLEDLFTDGSSFIEQIYIYGNALWTNVVAVVVPFQVAVEKWWQDTKAGKLIGW